MHFHSPDEEWSIPVETLGFINNDILVFIFNFVVDNKKQFLVNINDAIFDENGDFVSYQTNQLSTCSAIPTNSILNPSA